MKIVTLAVLALCAAAAAAEPVGIWPDLAPGETTRSTGTKQPYRPSESPPVTRVTSITKPTMTVHLAPQPNGAAAVILPGGGFGKVVPDKEGTEAAAWLNQLGVTAFVLSYRTLGKNDQVGWRKPLQDAQRAISLVRSEASRWKLDPERIGLVGSSAGGQVAARLLSGTNESAYARVDEIDDVSHRPDFALLIYPWSIYDATRDQLVDGVDVPPNHPPTFLVHTHDDRSSSLGAVLYYAALKRQGIAAELHVYGNGGHGYGLRPVVGSQIATWPNHAGYWLGSRGYLKK